jgi:hypothetical protein
MTEPYVKLLEQAKIHIPSGASFTGDFTERIRALLSLVDDDMSKAVLSIEPGDYVRIGSDESPGISLAAPIGYDVWYLFHTESILPFETGIDEERTIQILDRLEPFLSKLQNIKPLRTLRSMADLGGVFSGYLMKQYMVNNGPYMIKEMRFETILKGKSLKYGSGGKPTEQQVISYLAFPVGQLGVMEIISLISETMTEKDSFSIDEQEAIAEGLEMMPPIHNNRGHCIGTHLIEGGYLMQGNVEYPADDFIGQESIAPHQWLRHWIRGDDTWPVPGEFVVMVAKPELYHVWWFQEKYPFLYSGNWFETEFYTSGVVQEIIPPSDGSEELTNIYKVWVKCWELYLRSSDFYEYQVDERVAIVKDVKEYTGNCNWLKIKADGKDNTTSSAATPDSDWRICPISFYE